MLWKRQIISVATLATVILCVVQSGHAWPVVDVASWADLNAAVALSNSGGPGGSTCTNVAPCTLRIQDSINVNVLTTLTIQKSIIIERKGSCICPLPVLIGGSTVQMFYSTTPGVTLTLRGLRVINGLSTFGGAGVYLGEGTSGLFYNVEFSGHQAPTDGAAVRAYRARVTMEDVTFQNNKITAGTASGSFSGAAFAASGTALAAKRTRFLANKIVTLGVPSNAAHLGVAVSLHNSSAAFESCIFEDNVSENPSFVRGAALNVRAGSNVTIHGTSFTRNEVSGSTPGVSEGGAINAEDRSFIQVDMSSFTFNKVPNGYGGAVFLSGSKAVLCTNKFSNNDALAGTPRDLAVRGDGSLGSTASVCSCSTYLSYGVIPIMPPSTINFPTTCPC